MIQTEPSDQEKKLRLLRRQKKALEAQDDYLSFVEFTMPDPADPDDVRLSMYDAQKHHRAIAAVLEEIEKRNIQRLILSVPPRGGKSQLTSRHFPAWLVGRDPTRSVGLATYSDTFAEDFGRDVRTIMKSPAFQQVFPSTKLQRGSQSASRLRTMAGGQMMFIGWGGGFTGRGADYIILDDLFKDAVDAGSPTTRDKIWEWFNKVAMSRQSSHLACVIIIMTRWHEDDIIGRLTDPRNPHYDPIEAQDWKIINLPAIALDDDPLGRKPGEVLWPGRFPLKFLESQRRRDPRGFEALYQGSPTIEDGDFFKRDWVQYETETVRRPNNLRYYAASDHAVGLDKSRHDRTCLLVVGVDEGNNIWIVDCWIGREPADKIVERMLNFMRMYRPLAWWAEKGHISKAIGPFLRKKMYEEQVYCYIDEVTPVANKEQRAQSIQGRMANGKVFFPSKATPWVQEAVSELMAFPLGTHDDFVDTIAWIGLKLTRQFGPSAPPIAEQPPKVGTVAWLKAATREQERAAMRLAED